MMVFTSRCSYGLHRNMSGFLGVLEDKGERRKGLENTKWTDEMSDPGSEKLASWWVPQCFGHFGLEMNYECLYCRASVKT